MSWKCDQWDEVRMLFDVSREMPVERRQAFLRHRRVDGDLCNEIEALLEAHTALVAGAGEHFLVSLDAERAASLVISSDEEDLASQPEELSPGTMLGRYRMVRRLGSGGMSVVYLAHDDRLDRPVAVKLLPRQLDFDETARRRFEEEARAASALDHAHIATVYEINETEDGRPLIAMAWYEGETLQQRIERGPMPVAEVVAIAIQLADGLSAAHARGIVHCDIKPGNVIVSPGGAAKIIDFGIAKTVGAPSLGVGTIMGTVAYMSPEQTIGNKVGPQTDLWNLGVVIYEMLAGVRPFRADLDLALLYAIRNDEPEPIDRLRPDTSRGLARIVRKCLRKDVAQRYPDARALLADLRAFEKTGLFKNPLRKRTTVRAAGIAALFTIALLAALTL